MKVGNCAVHRLFAVLCNLNPVEPFGQLYVVLQRVFFLFHYSLQRVSLYPRSPPFYSKLIQAIILPPVNRNQPALRTDAFARISQQPLSSRVVPLHAQIAARDPQAKQAQTIKDLPTLTVATKQMEQNRKKYVLACWVRQIKASHRNEKTGSIAIWHFGERLISVGAVDGDDVDARLGSEYWYCRACGEDGKHVLYKVSDPKNILGKSSGQKTYTTAALNHLEGGDNHGHKMGKLQSLVVQAKERNVSPEEFHREKRRKRASGEHDACR